MKFLEQIFDLHFVVNTISHIEHLFLQLALQLIVLTNQTLDFDGHQKRDHLLILYVILTVKVVSKLKIIRNNLYRTRYGLELSERPPGTLLPANR